MITKTKEIKMFNSKQIKKAWKIRRESAVRFNCGVMEISWKECLKMAKEENVIIGTEKQIKYATDLLNSIKTEIETIISEKEVEIENLKNKPLILKRDGDNPDSTKIEKRRVRREITLNSMTETLSRANEAFEWVTNVNCEASFLIDRVNYGKSFLMSYINTGVDQQNNGLNNWRKLK